MDKTRLFEFLSTQDTSFLLDLLGQAYDQMDVDQRRWVFGKLVGNYSALLRSCLPRPKRGGKAGV